MKSKTIIITAIIVIVVAAAAFYGYTVYQKRHLRRIFGRDAVNSQSDRLGNKREGEIPKSGDLCSGTGGNGQIVSKGNNTITIKRKDGKSQIVHLTDQTTIKISTGSVSASDLKIGDRVTLVGGPNPDGSFTTNTVVVCQSGQ